MEASCQGDQGLQQTLPYDAELAASAYVDPKPVSWDDSRRGFYKRKGSTLELPGHSQDEELLYESQWRICDSQPTESTALDSQDEITDEKLAEEMAALQAVEPKEPAPTLGEPTGTPAVPVEPQEPPAVPVEPQEPDPTLVKPAVRVEPQEPDPTLVKPAVPVEPQEPDPTLVKPADPVEPQEPDPTLVKPAVAVPVEPQEPDPTLVKPAGPVEPPPPHPTMGEVSESDPEEPAPKKLPEEGGEPEDLDGDSDLEVVGATVAKSLVLSKLEKMDQQGLDLKTAIAQLRSENWEKNGPAPVVPRIEQFDVKASLTPSKGKGKGKGRGKGKAKAKAKAKAKNLKRPASARGSRKKPVAEVEQGFEGEPEMPEIGTPAEVEKPVERKRKPRAPKQKVPEEEKAQVDDEAGNGGQEPKLREAKSFARRPCPATSPAKDKWHAIMSTYKSKIYQKVRAAGGTPYAWED